MSDAVVLLSGGLDSSTTLGIADQNHENIYGLTFIYGQKHEKEIESAKRLASHYSIEEHMILDIPLSDIGRSSLLEGKKDIPIPEHQEDDIGDEEDIPSTYVPARNIILLSFGLSYAETIDAEAIYIGATARDYSGYPDCRPEFYEAFETMAEKGTRRGVEGEPITIRYPLIKMTKKEIVEKANRLDIPLEMTWSCYKGKEKACGRCDACKLRLRGFEEAGLDDPILYSQNGLD